MFLSGISNIEREELDIAQWATAEFKKIPKLVLLGHHDVNALTEECTQDKQLNEAIRKLPIFSFLVRCKDRFLHHNFVCALLNDLFGVQARGKWFMILLKISALIFPVFSLIV